MNQPQPSTARSRVNIPADALELMRRGHQTLDKLFFAFHLLCQRDDTASGKQALIARIALELAVHRQLLSEVVHPALQRVAEGPAPELIDGVVAESRQAQDSVREMLAVVVVPPLNDAARDARVEALGKFVDRQFAHERRVLFAALRRSGIDLNEMGQGLLKRRQALLAQGEVTEDESADPVGDPSL